jgi:hypothetical protein
VTWIVRRRAWAGRDRVLAYGLIVGAMLPVAARGARATSSSRSTSRARQRKALLSAVHELRAPERAFVAVAHGAARRTHGGSGAPLGGMVASEPCVVRALRVFGGTPVLGALLLPDLKFSATLTPCSSPGLPPGGDTGDDGACRASNAAVPKGASVDVGALSGFGSDSAELLFRTDTLQQWTHLPMSREKSKTFTSRLFGVAKATEYPC